MKRWWWLALGCWLAWGVVAAEAARYQVIDLGTLGVRSWAVAINQKGQVLGSWSPTSCCRWRLFLWENGVMKDLNIEAENPGSLNNLGQIVFQNSNPLQPFFGTKASSRI